LQFSQKLILPDNEFHRRVVTSGGAGGPLFTDPDNRRRRDRKL
jgi:hypothetical protein